MTPSNEKSKERCWLIRLRTGEVETCYELSILHHWIVSGRATRDAGISRSGKHWKALGDIRELAPFFELAEKLRSVTEQAITENVTIDVSEPSPDKLQSITPPSFGKRLPNIEAHAIRGGIHVGIITIRNDESDAMLKRLREPRKVVGGRRPYTLGLVPVADRARPARVALVRCLHQGQGDAQDVARDFIADLDPRWLMLTGIAGGAPDSEFSLGDVLLASYLHDFSVSAALAGGPSEYRAGGGYMHRWVEDLLASPTLAHELGGWNAESLIGRRRPSVQVPNSIRASELYGTDEWRKKVLQSLTANFTGESAARDPRMIIAATISSNALVKDDALLAQWKRSARNVASVEMELGGVYRSARRARDRHGNDREVPLLAVRGISDIVGYRREPEWTAYACDSAAALSYALIATGILQDVDPDIFTDNR